MKFSYTILFVQYQCYYFSMNVFSISISFCLVVVNKLFRQHRGRTPKRVKHFALTEQQTGSQGVKYFCLTDKLQKCEKCKLCCKVHSIYGDSLHFKTGSRKPGTAYLMFPQTPYKISISEYFHPKITSIPTSNNPTKIKHFTTFTTLKNIKTIFKNPSNPYK